MVAVGGPRVVPFLTRVGAAVTVTVAGLVNIAARGGAMHNVAVMRSSRSSDGSDAAVLDTFGECLQLVCDSEHVTPDVRAALAVTLLSELKSRGVVGPHVGTCRLWLSLI